MAGRVVVSTLNNDTGVLATQNGMTGIAKAWVNFNGTGTVAIRDSFNVSSITDNGTGDYTVNFTTAMPNANYSVSNYSAGSSNNWFMGRVVSYSTSAYRFLTIDNAGAGRDTDFANIAVFSS
jgi:hypothetical protein